MKVLQLSSPKSGTLWLYRILEKILDVNGIERRSYISGHPAFSSGENWQHHFAGRADCDFLSIRPEGYSARFAGQQYPVDDIDDYVRRSRHIRSHSPFCSRSRELFPKLDRIVYLIRDPRDRLISYANYIFLPERQAVDPGASRGYPDAVSYLNGRFTHEMHRWMQEVDGYLQHYAQFDIHVMFYERLLHAFEQEVDALLAYLGLSLSPQEWAVLKTEVAFSSMRQAHGAHVRQGRAGGWRDLLEAKHKQQAVRMAGPMLKLLNYSLDDSQFYDAAHLPSLPLDWKLSRARMALHRLLRYM